MSCSPCLHPPSPQTLVPLIFTKGSRDALEKVLHLQLWNHPVTWGIPACQQAVAEPLEQTSSEVTSPWSASPTKPPSPHQARWLTTLAGPSPLPRKAAALRKNRIRGVSLQFPLTTKSFSSGLVGFKNKASHPRDCLDYITGCHPAKLLHRPTGELGLQPALAANGRPHSHPAIDHICERMEFIISLMLLLFLIIRKKLDLTCELWNWLLPWNGQQPIF